MKGRSRLPLCVTATLVGLAMLLGACAPAATPTTQPTKAPEKPPAESTKPVGAPTAVVQPTKPAAEAPKAAPAAEWGTISIPKGGTIRVGFGAALTGDLAKHGTDIKNGAQFAVDEKGTLKGFKIELRAEDDECSGAASVAVAEKMINDPLVVGFIGNMCSDGAIAASDVYNRARIVMISASATAGGVTAKKLPIVNRTMWSDIVQGAGAAEFALKKGFKTAAALHDKSAYGQGLADEFKKNFEAGGGKVVAYEVITRGDKDFTPVLTKIKPTNPEIIYLGVTTAEAALLARQIRDVGMQGKYISAEGIYDEKDFIDASGGAAEGTYLTFAKTPEGTKFQDWKAKIEAKYGPIGAFTAHAYDAVNVLLAAVEKVAIVGSDGRLQIDKKALAEAVRATDLEGVTGRIKFDDKGDRVDPVVVVRQIQGRKLVDVK